MGNSCSQTKVLHSTNPYQCQKATEHSKLIDRQLMDEKVRRAKEVKVLLLGAGESPGKTTILKQMQILHNPNGFSALERDQFRREQIFSNLHIGIKVCLDLIRLERIEFADPSLMARHSPPFIFGTFRTCVPLFGSCPSLEEGETYPSKFFDSLGRLWKDRGVQSVISQSNATLQESFFPYLDRLFDPGYVPSDLDILRCRRAMIGITEMSFTVSDLVYRSVCWPILVFNLANRTWS
ncbi:hypothetical protein CROQUDRAFT_39784 [Cronartium quercuum f. sp. fusiforme G11]|uniref:Uncharacterized protein n=1 Tax=Cronartium quercuum f. sp. fusiforme G11 TaxID=708437 RepID=A0A9P6NSL4_9BASI|nr:hypothetical protein CROQUDRAFT_39784 [Cronartium quercuum f. sp. fusiforme G11]